MTIVPDPEVSSVLVHRFLKFIDKHPEIKVVKLCPECSMPCITGSYSSQTLSCENCRDYFLKGESELVSMNTSEYIKVIKKLPLRNRGKYYVSAWERETTKHLVPMTYEDLPPSDIASLDAYIKHNNY